MPLSAKVNVTLKNTFLDFRDSDSDEETRSTRSYLGSDVIEGLDLATSPEGYYDSPRLPPQLEVYNAICSKTPTSSEVMVDVQELDRQLDLQFDAAFQKDDISPPPGVFFCPPAEKPGAKGPLTRVALPLKANKNEPPQYLSDASTETAGSDEEADSGPATARSSASSDTQQVQSSSCSDIQTRPGTAPQQAPAEGPTQAVCILVVRGPAAAPFVPLYRAAEMTQMPQMAH